MRAESQNENGAAGPLCYKADTTARRVGRLLSPLAHIGVSSSEAQADGFLQRLACSGVVLGHAVARVKPSWVRVDLRPFICCKACSYAFQTLLGSSRPIVYFHTQDNPFAFQTLLGSSRSWAIDDGTNKASWF
jgi:hypothetical protein